jgi:ABC-type sugar transport system ATPase subunit
MNFIEGVLWDASQGKLQVGHLQLEFNTSKNGGKDHKEVILGIRPENIEVSVSPKQGFFEAQSDFIEPIGNRIIIHLVAMKLKMKAKIEKIKEINKGSKVWVKFPSDRILLFDPKNGDKFSHKLIIARRLNYESCIFNQSKKH